jgi:hypothetical protein
MKTTNPFMTGVLHEHRKNLQEPSRVPKNLKFEIQDHPEIQDHGAGMKIISPDLKGNLMTDFRTRTEEAGMDLTAGISDHLREIISPDLQEV